MKKNYHLYLGKAGHLTVMAEFLTRGWNVATPEVDIGDDIFVVQDDSGILRRVQVKTSTATYKKGIFQGQFNVPVHQLNNISNVLVHYVFIVRHADSWSKPVIIRQDYLLDHLQNENIGSLYKGNLNIRLKYYHNKVYCSKLDFSQYIADYADFPLIDK